MAAVMFLSEIIFVFEVDCYENIKISIALFIFAFNILFINSLHK